MAGLWVDSAEAQIITGVTAQLLKLGWVLLIMGVFWAPPKVSQATNPHMVYLPLIFNAAGPYSGPFGYGWEVGYWPAFQPGNPHAYPATSFNWIKVSTDPQPEWLCNPRLPHNVLLRLNIIGQGRSLSQVAEQAREIAIALQNNSNPCIEAFEIGNEPNLHDDFGWGGPPDPTAYTAQLCAAYGAIKSVWPQVIVVSGGLAPVGRIQGNVGGYLGNNGLAMDEQHYTRAMLQAGAGNCFDAFGYHNYGFAAPPSAAPGTIACGANDFCFRGVERIHAILSQAGVYKRIWTTEFGWLRDPRPACHFPDRAWYYVSEQQQADYLVGAFAYARQNWPWMGAMFVFNLDFNTVPWYDECEQMRYFGVKLTLAEAALEAMPKLVWLP